MTTVDRNQNIKTYREIHTELGRIANVMYDLNDRDSKGRILTTIQDEQQAKLEKKFVS
jgi:hypothetical protein